MVMTLRLLYLTAETCPTFRADVAVLFGKYLPRLGVHSDIVAGKTPGYDGSIVWGGGDSYLSDVSGGQAKRHVKILLNGIKTLFCADRTRYDAIQVRDMPLLATVGLLAARIKYLPFFYWMSYPIPEGQIQTAKERGLSSGWIKFLFPWVRGRVGRFLLYQVVLPLADHVFVQSEHMKRDMIERGIPEQKMTSVPMGVDLELLQQEEISPSEDPCLKGRRAIVYLGYMDWPRCIEVLFEMLALVRQHIPDTLLMLVGDADDNWYREWLKRQAEAAGVADHVLWTGWLPMLEGWRYVRAAEVALSPIPRGPLFDGSSPTKLPEYLALGVPVVCNDNPDQESIIQACGSGRCVLYTAENFASAVIELMGMKNEDRLENINFGLQYIVDHRGYHMIAENLATTYRTLLDRARGESSKSGTEAKKEGEV